MGILKKKQVTYGLNTTSRCTNLNLFIHGSITVLYSFLVNVLYIIINFNCLSYRMSDVNYGITNEMKMKCGH